MVGHFAQVAVSKLAHQRGVIGDKVTRYAIHGVGDEVERIATRPFVVGWVDAHRVQGTALAI
ncbi:hypothetical protein D3C84_1244310 [compost metagenome]